MIGENIKRLRTAKGLTQKDLADKLYVTAQAVSRWENNEVEPSINTIKDMARLFNVQTDELLEVETNKTDDTVVVTENEQKQENKEEVSASVAKPVLAVCEQCNRPIYNPNEIIRNTHTYGRTHKKYVRVLCTDCDKKNKARAAAAAYSAGKKRRVHAFVWPSILLAIILGVFIALAVVNNQAGYAIGGVVGGIGVYCWLACMILYNNFIFNMTLEIFSWGFVKFPGVIFSLSFDGILWLIWVKVLFWILGFMLAFAAGAFAILIGAVCGVFTYPFALRKNFVDPYSTCND